MNNLIIDVREKKLKDYFSNKEDNNIIIKQLDLGDIILSQDEEVKIIIEININALSGC